MKKIIYFIAALTIISCKTEPKDYATFSGKITNKNSDSIIIRNRTYSKTIKVNEDGTFSDTLHVKTGIYNFFDGKEQTSFFLKNGFDLKMTLDAKMFDETAKYTGKGAETSNFLAENALLQEKSFDEANFENLNEEQINAKFSSIKKEFLNFYDTHKAADTSVTNKLRNNIDMIIGYFKTNVTKGLKMEKLLKRGAKSPSFDNFENYDGSKTSLSDLKGKYVYIDVWATWCGPCKREIPSLKKLEKAYHGKKIAFVSISVDDDRSHKGSWDKAREDWKQMVAEKQLGGIQLFAPKGWETKFVKDYFIDGIPRFILIDPNGNVVTPDAPRPSSQEIIDLFNKENI